MPMTGLYGEPLELLKTIIAGLVSFQAFSPDGAVHLYERIGDDTDVEPGDAWAVLNYAEGGHSIVLAPSLDVTRIPTIMFVRAVRTYSQAAKESIVNDVGTIVTELIRSADATGIITRVDLQSFAIDEDAEPPRIGAVVKIHMDL